jgi:hypothetical protein
MDATTSPSITAVAVALAPGFACGFAVQQALQILDPVVQWILNLVGGLFHKKDDEKNQPIDGDTKRAVLGLISFVIGMLIADFGHLNILTALISALKSQVEVSSWIDILVSGLIISAGTEGFNSIMKFLSYQKEAAKSDAAVKKANAADTPAPPTRGSLALVNG